MKLIGLVATIAALALPSTVEAGEGYLHMEEARKLASRFGLAAERDNVGIGYSVSDCVRRGPRKVTCSVIFYGAFEGFDLRTTATVEMWRGRVRVRNLLLSEPPPWRRLRL